MFKNIVAICTKNRERDLRLNLESIFKDSEYKLDFVEPTKSLPRVIENGYDLAVIEMTTALPVTKEELLDLINLGYVTGKKVLVLTKYKSDVITIENRIGKSIKEAVNIKYTRVPLDPQKLKRRLTQLKFGITKDVSEIFKEIEKDIVQNKNRVSFASKILSTLSL